MTGTIRRAQRAVDGADPPAEKGGGPLQCNRYAGGRGCRRWRDLAWRVINGTWWEAPFEDEVFDLVASSLVIFSCRIL
jgi:hypothetical protein